MTPILRHMRTAFTTMGQWITRHLPRWGRRPPLSGVREPRRPKPTLPGAGVALAEPRLLRRIRLNRHTRLRDARGGDTGSPRR